MRLASVPAEGLAPIWPQIAAFLQKVCARSESDLTLEALRDVCARREGLLVTIHDATGSAVAAGVTQVRDYDDGRRSCWVLAVGGAGARAWRGTLREIEAGARANGCASVEFVGRAGWGRLLPDYAATPCERGTHYLKRLV